MVGVGLTDRSSQAQSALPPKAPIDATAVAHDAGDVLADAPVENRLPWHEAEAETVVTTEGFDHGEATTSEIGRADQRAADVLADPGRLIGLPTCGRHLRSDASDFLSLQAGDEIVWRADAAVRRAPDMTLFEQRIFTSLQRLSDVLAESRVGQRHALA